MNETLDLICQAAEKLRHETGSLTYEREVVLAQQALVALGLAQTLVEYAATPHQSWRS